jgi:hypothetical protein
MARLAALEDIATSTTTSTRLSIDTLIGVVEGLRTVTPLETLSKNLKLSEDEIFKIVTGLGTWLIHAHGAAPGDIAYASDQNTEDLHQSPTTVMVPLGFDRRRGRRYDVKLSIRAIIVHDPDQAELARYIDRQFPNETATLIGRDIFALWRLATTGQLHRLQDGSMSKSWAGVMLEAYDLLDVSLADAHRAARELVSVDALDTTRLGDALTKLAWLNESRVRRVSALLEMSQEDESSQSARIVERELELFVKELCARPAWLTPSIDKLTQGQVLRLVERNGLGLDPETRRIELDVRRELTARNLKRDFDLLVADGVRATLLGASDVFWSALDARAEGDHDWRDSLDALLETAQ